MRALSRAVRVMLSRLTARRRTDQRPCRSYLNGGGEPSLDLSVWISRGA